jgi:hypothetical protein
MITYAFILFLWLHHVERGVVHIPQNGVVIVGFKKPFKDRFKMVCSADKAKFRTWHEEWGEMVGTPGERVAWKCQ